MDTFCSLGGLRVKEATLKLPKREENILVKN